MAHVHSITLASHGDYWLARYYNGLGQRRGKVLGPKASLSRRQALVLCERLAVELQVQPGKAELGKAPSINAWLDTFFRSKPDLGAKARRAYTLAAAKFIAFAGAETRIDRVTPAAAGGFVTQLAAEKDGQKLSPATVANYARHVRCLFNEAVHQRLILTNPFDRIATQPKAFKRKWHYVPREQLTTILTHCPNHGWKCFLALQRIGAMRKGEALQATWEMIDWNARTLTLPRHIVKTEQDRVIPLDPELFTILEAAKIGVTDRSARIVLAAQVDQSSDSNQHKRFRTILKRAGIEPWEDLFQTLRRNAVQDLRALFGDGWTVTAIAGHSEEVERAFYLGRVRQSDLDRVTGQHGTGSTETLLDQIKRLPAVEQRKIAALLSRREQRVRV